MATYSSKVKPFSFVNPGLIKTPRFAMATAIKKSVGKDNKTDVSSPPPSQTTVVVAKRSLLGLNRLGGSIYSLGLVQQQIRDTIVSEFAIGESKKKFFKRKEQYLRDQASEKATESQQPKIVEEEEVKEKGKKELSWLEKLFEPFKGIIEFALRAFISQALLRWIADPKNGERLGKIVDGLTKYFGFVFGVVQWSVDQFLTGVSSVFGDGSKTGLARFAEVLGGLGQIILGIAGLKAAMYLLNPFALVGDVLGLVGNLFNKKPPAATPGAPPTPGPGGAPTPAAKPRAAVQKIAAEYGDDAAKYYDDLISRGKNPVQALTAVRSRFKKLPVKPKGPLGQFGDLMETWKKKAAGGLDNLKSGVMKGWDNVKMLGGSLTKGIRQKLAASKKWFEKGVSEKLSKIAKSAYDLLEKKGIISTAKKVGQKAKNAITKIPGYDKVMKKVAQEGGEKMLGKIGGKAIPIIGGLVNLYFAYDRLRNGDKSGAALEALSAILDLSGLFGFAPGPMISLGLDAYLFGRDFFPDVVKKENEFLDKIIGGVMSPLKSIQDSLPKVPFLNDGGIITKPTIAVLGERQPEALIPLQQVNNSADGIAQTLVSAIEGSLRSMGASGELARQVLSGDLQNVKTAFNIKSVSAATPGETLGKSVVKVKDKKSDNDVDAVVAQLIGTDKPNTTGTARMDNMRAALANIVVALSDAANKKVKGGGGNKGSSGSSGSNNSGGENDDTDMSDLPVIKPGPMHSKGAQFAKQLMSKLGIKDYQAAGIVGNLIQESALVPDRIQNHPPSKGGTLKLDGKTGYSYPQWTEPSRQKNFAKYMEKKGFDWKTKNATHQMAFGFLVEEFKTYQSHVFDNTKNAAAASNWVLKNYEKPADQGPEEQRERAADSNAVLAKMAGGGSVMAWNRKNAPPGESFDIIEAKDPPEGGWKKFAAGGKFKNGKLPDSELESIGNGHKLHKSVAKQFRAMMEAAKGDGHALGSGFRINSSYRSYERQAQLYKELGPGTAARAGTSNHGFGLAVDLWFTNGAFKWLKKNGPKFGFDQIPHFRTNNPDGHEAWHWENVSGKGSIDGGTPTDNTGTGGDGKGGDKTDEDSQEAPEKSKEEQISDFMNQIAGAITQLNTPAAAPEAPAAAPAPAPAPAAEPGKMLGGLLKFAMGGPKLPSAAYRSRETPRAVESGLTDAKKTKNKKKFAAGGSHRVIPNTPESSWSAGIPLTYVRANGHSAEVAVPLAKRFQGFLNDLKGTGYKIDQLGGFRKDGPPYGNVDGKGPQYSHPYGAAIDINWNRNPAFKKAPNDFPSNIKEIAKKHGLGWGNAFDDAMHFSAMKREYGAGVNGQEISRKSLMGSKDGDNFDPADASGGPDGSATPKSDGDAEAPEKSKEEQLKDLFDKLASDIVQLNTGEKPDAAPAAETTGTPAKPAPGSGKPAPPAGSTPAPPTGNPPGALVPGQRPDKSLTREQFAVAQKARSEAKAAGLTGKAYDVYVANAVMGIPQQHASKLSPAQPAPAASSSGASLSTASANNAAAEEAETTKGSTVPIPVPINRGGQSQIRTAPPQVVRARIPITYGF